MRRVEFKPPDGFMLPEGKASGDKFDSIATFQIKPNGTICLVAIGDYTMPGYEDKADNPTYRDEGAEVAAAYRGAMG